MFVDSHCHLSFPELADQLPEIRAGHGRRPRSTGRCASAPRWRNSRPCMPWPWSTTTSGPRVGVHPDNEGVTEPSVRTWWSARPCPGWWPSAKPASTTTRWTSARAAARVADMEWQRERFRTHIRAARQCGKPLVIHTRGASADTLAILKEEGEDGSPGSGRRRVPLLHRNRRGGAGRAGPGLLHLVLRHPDLQERRRTCATWRPSCRWTAC